MEKSGVIATSDVISDFHNQAEESKGNQTF